MRVDIKIFNYDDELVRDKKSFKISMITLITD